MTLPAADRPPFDGDDARRAEAYLASIGLTSFDPFATGTASPDLILTTSLADARLMMAEGFTTTNATGQAFRAYPLFVERAAPNAFAIDHDGLQICAVNIGLVSAAYELALFVFSQATLFREIGDAAGERSPVLPSDAALSFWIADQLRAGEGAAGRPVGAELVPQDGERQTAALFLTLLMLRFVWLHELFHCLNGHTGYRAQQRHVTALHEITDGDMLSLVEIEQPAEASLRIGEGRCMEFDADRAAFWALVQRQADGEEPIDGIRALPALLRLRLTTFAAVLMTFLFDQSAKRRSAAVGGTHPAAYHRLHNLIRTLASNVTDPAGQTRQLFAHTVVEMDQFHSCMPQAVAGSTLLRDFGSVELQREFNKVEEALLAARSRFESKTFRTHNETA